MASKTKTTEAIRDRKKAPNKANQKAEKKRINKNIEIIRKVAEAK
jgi:hypothetical protein